MLYRLNHYITKQLSYIKILVIFTHMNTVIQKLYCLSICFVIWASSFGQTSIQLIMKNDGKHKFEKIDVFDVSQKEFYTIKYQDTANFFFKKTNIDNYIIRYQTNDKVYKQFIWLDTGLIKIEVHIDDLALKIDTVYNSPVYYEHLNFSKNYTSLYQKKDTAVLTDILLKLFEKNIDNPYSLQLGNNYIDLHQNSRENLLRLKTLTDRQGDKFSWFIFYQTVNQRLNKILTITSLDLNAYTFISSSNKKVKLPTLSDNKYYLLDFWFLACKPCISDHKEIFKKQQLLAEKKIELISISIDDSVKELNHYLNKNNYKWTNYLETDHKRITKDLGTSTFPTYLILNRTGKIICSQNSFNDVLKCLEKTIEL